MKQPESQIRYQTVDEINSVVRGFEECSIQPSAFTHRAHLTVALRYLLESPAQDEAAARMRVGLKRLLAQYGHQHGYHETITLFWMERVRRNLDRADRTCSIVDLTNEMIESCGASSRINDYYSRERLASNDAREKWVEPDLKPLDS